MSTMINFIKGTMQIIENADVKMVRSPDYNFNFDKHTGRFERWGITKEDDPVVSKFPEIVDLELTTICKGIRGRLCPWCYKSNTGKGTNMTLDTFKRLMSKLPVKLINQCAFGLDSTCTSNPEWYEIFKHCRELGIIPNTTIADIDDATADKLASVCGAVAVSRYEDRDVAYDSIKRLTDLGMTQVNMHFPLFRENYSLLTSTMYDILTDRRLSKLNAIVILSLKKCGRGIDYTQLEQPLFNHIVQFAMERKIKLGADSCSAFKVMEALKTVPEFETLKQSIECCCATRFSSYIDVEGNYFPCSFSVNVPGWEKGINVLECSDFIKDVWNSPRTVEFRNKLIANGCNCPIYKI